MLQALKILLLLYVGWCLVLFALQRHVLFPRWAIPAPGEPALAGRGIERWWLPASFGRVEAWYLPPPADAEPAPAILFAHGNGELIDFWPETLGRLRDLGLALLLVEYPGYGRSEGSPSQRRIAEAFDLAYDRLASRPEVDRRRIVFLGRSLGGGAVGDLSLRRPAAALVLLSSFTSVRAFAVRYLAPPLLIRDPFDNLAALARYPGPVLILHGRNDEIVPFGHAEKLRGAARRATLVAYEAGHNDCPPDWERLVRDVEGFLRKERILTGAGRPRQEKSAP
ncbi:MAG: alpha/beta hydrolase [Desulfobacterales bacterium]